MQIRDMNTEQRAEVAAQIKHIMEVAMTTIDPLNPTEDSPRFAMTESAPVGTPGRTITVVTQYDGDAGFRGEYTWKNKSGVAKMYGRFSAEACKRWNWPDEVWHPVSSSFPSVAALLRSNWKESLSKWHNLNDFSEFRIASID